MLKKGLIIVAIFAGLLALALTYITARYIDKEEILRATQEREDLQKQRVELLALVAKADSVKKHYTAKSDSLEKETDMLRANVDSLEGSRQTVQLNVRKLRTNNDLENQLMEAFPEIKTSMKITEVPVENFPDIKLTYFSVPFRFSETFLIDHQNSENYLKQRDKLKDLDAMQVQVINLQKKIVGLEEEKSAAYKQGYDSAYVKYLSLNEKYIKLLNTPPKVEFGLPHIGAIAIGTAAGFVGGVAVGAASK